MLKSWQYWLLATLGAAALVLVGVNIGLYNVNRAVQASLSARNQYLQQSGPIRDIYQEMVKALAELSVKNHDEQIAAMLASEGFRISAPPGDASTAKGSTKQ
jgi:hypothetical protein